MRRKRAVTRAKAARLGYTRLQPANAGTLKTPVRGHVLGPPNRHWAEIEGGVQRPRWLTPKKPSWVPKLFKFGKYAGLGGLVAGTAYGLLSGSETPRLKNRKPLPGYLDRLYPKKSESKMAPIRRRMMSRKRILTRAPRRFKKRVGGKRRRAYKRRGRRMRRSKGPLMNAIRRTSKRIKMGHYTNEKRFLRICDVIEIGDYGLTTLPTPQSGLIAGITKYRPLGFRIKSLPNLMARLGSTIDKFDEFKIDKITYKVTVLNARQLSMDPNYKAPDGSGQSTAVAPVDTMINKHDYVPNTYVFHKRYQNDDLADQDFLDWRKTKVAMKGACTFVNLFRQKGKMFNTAITADRADDIYIDNTAIPNKKHGQPLGWQKFNDTIDELKVGQAGIILPGQTRTGWDGLNNNIYPSIRVTARVCSSVRSNAAGIDGL